MMKKLLSAAALLLPLFYSCSTTRVLGEGEYRLAENKIIIENAKTVPGGKELNKGDLSDYIKQRSNTHVIFGWNPFLNIYNWADPAKDDGWARFCRKIGQKPVVLDEGLIPVSETQLTSRLRYLGWYNSNVKADVKYKKKKAYVRYRVNLGERYRIDDISYSLPQEGDFAEEFLPDTLNSLIRRGDWLSENLLESETVRSTSVMRNKGYYDFSKNHFFFVADTLQNPGKLLLDYGVRGYTRNEDESDSRPLRKFYIGKVTIEHSPEVPFRKNVLLRLNTLKPGQLYSEDAVNIAYGRMSSLRLFNSVSVEMTPSDTATVDCRIKLSESAIQGFKVNLEASSNSSGLVGIAPKLNYYHKNIFHGGEWFNLYVGGNFQFKIDSPIRSNEASVSASISFPKFLGLPYSIFTGPNIPRTEVSGSFNYQDRTEYKRNIASLTYGYSGTFLKRYRFLLNIPRVSYVHLYTLDPEFKQMLERNPFMRYAYQDHLDAGVGGTLHYTTNNDVVPKTSYHFWQVNVDLSGNVISMFDRFMPRSEQGQALILSTPYTQYVRGEFSVGQTLRFGKSDAHALSYRFLIGAGYPYGNSQAMPFEKQFYCGGANSMRGWQARALGPGSQALDTSFSIPSQTGEAKLEFDVEYRMPIFWKIEGALFAECGNVWNIRNSEPEASVRTFYKTLAADWGLGVRLNLDFILVRIDVGFQTYDPVAAAWYGPGKWFTGKSCVHFGVGYPF